MYLSVQYENNIYFFYSMREYIGLSLAKHSDCQLVDLQCTRYIIIVYIIINSWMYKYIKI